MHESTRRNLCRCGFALLCVVPTFVTVTFACYRHSDTYQEHLAQAWGQQLGRQLGYRVAVQAVELPRPGVTVLRGIRVADPETLAHVGSIHSLEVAQLEYRRSVLLRHVELDRDELANLLTALQFGLQRQVADTSMPVTITCGEITLTSRKQSGPYDGPATTLKHVEASLQSDQDRMTFTMAFHLANSDPLALLASEQIQVSCTRDRTTRPLQTEWVVQTGDASVPCDTFAGILPLLKRCGEDATFSGQVTVWQNSDSWSGEVVGNFVDLDLRQLTQVYKHRVTGMATTTNLSVRFTDGLLTQASGGIHIEAGAVGSELLAVAEEKLGVTVSQRVSQSGAQQIGFQRLGLGFNIKNERYAVSGIAHANYPGVICSDTYGALVSQYDEHQTAPLISMFGGRTDILMQVFGPSIQEQTDRQAPRVATPPRATLRIRH